MDFIPCISEYFFKNNIDFKLNASMKEYTTFKIGGNIDVLVFPKTILEIKKIILYCLKKKKHYIFLGRCSNILVDDDGIRGVGILFSHNFSETIIDGNKIKTHCGMPLSKLCITAYENSLSGLEFAWGIPGSVGGAVYMNAGAYGKEIKDIIIEAEYMDEKGDIYKIHKNEMELGYRTSIFMKKSYCILSMTIDLTKKKSEEIKKDMDDIISRRLEKQPTNFPSAGSVFKRPNGSYAGFLISECGLKGYSIGDAQVSEKHAGFIINKGNATCSDVFSLMEHIREEVFKKTNYYLEYEIKKI
ncbi:MAG: UDP-N-acetylmuramate dehydrogenase [Oscillospiraceae bacterium]|nr:UDP-N-acetylmuramate dehydrogenase [Oscillospiraceae bacterium]